MPRNSTLSEQYDNFLNNYAKQDFERVAQGKSLKVKHIENFHGNTLYSSALSFSVVGTENRLELYDNKRSCQISIAWDQSSRSIDFYSDEVKNRFCKFIVQQFLSDSHSTEKIENKDGKKVTQFSGTFKAEELIERFRGYKNRREFSKIAEGITSTEPNNSEKLAKRLNLIKNNTQNITDVLKAIGTVSPGSGLMPHQIPKFSREEYLSFVDSTFTEPLKGFGEVLSFKEGHDYVCMSEFIIADNNGNEISASNHKKEGEWHLEIKSASLNDNYAYQYNSSEAHILGKIADSVYWDGVLHNSKESESTKIKSCNPFNKTDFLTFLKEGIPNSYRLQYYLTGEFVPSKSRISPFNCKFYPIDAAAGLTILSTMVASFINTTTPAIGYNNSTNTSITNDSFNTTTSRPEQDVDEGGISAGAIAGIVGMGAVATILCRIGYYCWNKVRHSGKYYANKESGSASYKKHENVDDDVRSKCLSTIEEGQGENEQGAVAGEEQPLLNQPSTSASGRIVISGSNEGINPSLEGTQVGSAIQPAPSR